MPHIIIYTDLQHEVQQLQHALDMKSQESTELAHQLQDAQAQLADPQQQQQQQEQPIGNER